MKVFLDANVLVSILNKEYPIFTYSSRVLSLSGSGKFEVCTTPLCLAIAFYFASKKSGQKKAKQKIDVLHEHVQLVMIDQEAVRMALINPSVEDLEDGFQYYAAIQNGCSCMITENKNDFFFSKIPVLGCEQFLKMHVF